MKSVCYSLLLFLCLCLWKCNDDKERVDPNRPPTINKIEANPNTIEAGSKTTLTCTACDEDEDSLKYSWDFVAGQIQGSGAVVTWVAPDDTGIFIVSCIVSDGEHRVSSSTEVGVTAGNHAPIIKSLTANPDTLYINDTTLLACSASDPDEDELTYDWQSEHGSLIGSGDSIAWTAPDLPGTFIIKCIVSDGNRALDYAEVKIIVNALPVANAGPDQEVMRHMMVCLEGNEGSDPNGNALTYNWSFITKPNNSLAKLSDKHSSKPSFIADADGAYVLQLVVSDGTTESKPNEVTVIASTPSVTYQLHGLNFSPYIDEQDPNQGVQISEKQLRNRMAVIAPYTQWVRTFGSTNGLEKSGELAHSMGLKTAIGAWLSRDSRANDQEINNLIDAANAGHVDIAIVGSETLLRNDLSEEQLIGYINQVRNAIPSSIPVTTGYSGDTDPRTGDIDPLV